ncbi:MAG TPA: hypothetical protein DCY40_03425 [Actinobacteria bacterium]|nr:hypothetical protein [Actinomycetota bacterium]
MTSTATPELPTWEISNPRSGAILGRWDAATAEAALDAMARDAGYADYADCCEQVPPPDGGLDVVNLDALAKAAATGDLDAVNLAEA